MISPGWPQKKITCLGSDLWRLDLDDCSELAMKKRAMCSTLAFQQWQGVPDPVVHRIALRMGFRSWMST